MLHCRPHDVLCRYICTSSQSILWPQTKQSLPPTPRPCCRASGRTFPSADFSGVCGRSAMAGRWGWVVCFYMLLSGPLGCLVSACPLLSVLRVGPLHPLSGHTGLQNVKKKKQNKNMTALEQKVWIICRILRGCLETTARVESLLCKTHTHKFMYLSLTSPFSKHEHETAPVYFLKVFDVFSWERDIPLILHHSERNRSGVCVNPDAALMICSSCS